MSRTYCITGHLPDGTRAFAAYSSGAKIGGRIASSVAEAMTRPFRSVQEAEVALLETGYSLSDGERIRAMTQRLGEVQTERVLRASRIASQLEEAVRGFNDPIISAAIARLQLTLAAKLPARAGDGPDRLGASEQGGR
jgi:hypothetical protein